MSHILQGGTSDAHTFVYETWHSLLQVTSPGFADTDSKCKCVSAAHSFSQSVMSGSVYAVLHYTHYMYTTDYSHIVLFSTDLVSSFTDPTTNKPTMSKSSAESTKVSNSVLLPHIVVFIFLD